MSKTLPVGLLVVALAFVVVPRDETETNDARAAAERFTDRATYDSMTPWHRTMLERISTGKTDWPDPVIACWELAAPNDQSAIDAFNNALISMGTPSLSFQTGNRWSNTAMSGGGLGQGDPTILTYSFVPDGTPIGSGVGEPASPSDLFATFNGLYGSAATWQQLVHDTFDRWEELTGITYVFETNDDGVTLGSASGVAGVRGDVRIGGHFVDGQSGSNVLAYNSFPNNGDMVLDTSNTGLYGSTTNNSRLLRNVVSHEHGHGLGFFHVCPRDLTKLMEPTLASNFDGPQEDDILAGQRQYGDRFEPNDTPAGAANLGGLANGTANIVDVATDDNSDVDYYEFTVAGTKEVVVQLRPTGSNYLQGPQTQACDTGAPFDALNVADLGVELLAGDGVTVLGSANVNPAGQNELIPPTQITTGTYYIRVTPNAVNNVQRYEMDITVNDFTTPPFVITYPNGLPSETTPDLPESFLVRTVTGPLPDPDSAVLFTSIEGAPFQATAMQHVGGRDFIATFPAAPCFSDITWFVSINAGDGSGTAINPQGAPFALNTTRAIGPLEDVFADNFETNQGWSVTNSQNLSDGAWTRGTPVGGGDRGDPPVDSDGSGQCFLTDNVDGNSDVDNGVTRLLSPVIDVSGEIDVLISVDFWFDNNINNNVDDSFRIDVSDNGGATWVNMETYSAAVDQWVHREYRVGRFVNLTSQLRVRFLAEDINGPSVVEAGVDNFRVQRCIPSALGACGRGTVGLFSGGPFETLFVNGSSGGVARKVTLAPFQSFSISVDAPPGFGGTADFAIFGMFGVPDAMDQTILPGLLFSPLCFTPCIAAPTDPNLFTLANTYFSGPCGRLVPATPAPWTVNIPGGVPGGLVFTLQGLQSDDDPLVSFPATNGIIVEVQ